MLLFSHSVMSEPLWPYGLQHTGISCPSQSPRVCSNLCLLNRWYHPTISSSITCFSSCLQSLLASGSFPVSQLLNQVSKWWTFNISPSNEYSGLISFRIDWFGHVTVQRTVKSNLQYRSSKASILQHSSFLNELSHPYMATGKTIALTVKRVTGRKARGLQMEEIGCKCQTFFIFLKW